MAEETTVQASRPRRRAVTRQAPATANMPQVSGLPYTDEADWQEAVTNFRRYLEILQEWERREREQAGTRDVPE